MMAILDGSSGRRLVSAAEAATQSARLTAARSPEGRRVAWDFVDMYRVTGGRIVWRYLLCDWKGLLDQITAAGGAR